MSILVFKVMQEAEVCGVQVECQLLGEVGTASPPFKILGV